MKPNSRLQINPEQQDEDQVLRTLRDWLHEDYGIYFNNKKLYSLSNKIDQRIRQVPVETLPEYVQYLRQHPDEEIQEFLDCVSTNKTFFFREPKHWNFLVEQVLPSLKTSETVKMWSAACSSGEEPYTLAMLLDDHLIGNSSGSHHITNSRSSNFKILATDIAREAVLQGQKGVYSENKIKSVREHDQSYLSRYFEAAEDEDNYRVREHIRESVTFRKFNLKSSSYPYPNSFSLILCRNVLIYFDDEMIEHVIDQLTSCLEPGGYLFVGHSESLQNIDHDLKKIRPAIYRRPKTTHVRD